MHLCLRQNASAFKIKRLCVCIETYLRFKPNAKAFFNDLTFPDIVRYIFD